MKSEKSGGAVSPALSAALDNGDARGTIVFAREKAAKLSDPESRLVDSRAEEVRHGLFVKKDHAVRPLFRVLQQI